MTVPSECADEVVVPRKPFVGGIHLRRVMVVMRPPVVDALAGTEGAAAVDYMGLWVPLLTG